jgi:hypothetical protein
LGVDIPYYIRRDFQEVAVLTKVYGKFVCQCDGCDETLDLDTADFEGARAGINSEGWKSTKNKNNWEHFCKNCQD